MFLVEASISACACGSSFHSARYSLAVASEMPISWAMSTVRGTIRLAICRSQYSRAARISAARWAVSMTCGVVSRTAMSSSSSSTRRASAGGRAGLAGTWWWSVASWS